MDMLRILRNAVLAGWALLGAVFLGATLFYGGVFFSIHPTPWNFPGDPPLFDVLIYVAGIAAAINLPVWLLAMRFWAGPRGLVASLPRICSIVSLLMFVGAGAG